MKKALALLAPLALLALCGCVTNPDHGGVEWSPYLTGRITTRVFLYKQAEGDLKPSVEEATITAYKSFHALMQSVEKEDFTDFRVLLQDELKKALDDELVLGIALDLIALYWQQLTHDIDYGQLKGEEQYEVLSEFHRGIEDALEVAQLVTPDESSDATP